MGLSLALKSLTGNEASQFKRLRVGDCVMLGFVPASTASCHFSNGGLNRPTQHFILKGKDGVWDGTEIS
jgi:hypothetical protein